MAVRIHEHLALLILEEEISWEEILEKSGQLRSLVRVISPSSIVIDPAAVDPLVTWLRRHGYLPQVVG